MKNFFVIYLLGIANIFAQEASKAVLNHETHLLKPVKNHEIVQPYEIKKIPVVKQKETKYTDDDLKRIDSLLIDGQYNATLADASEYIIKDKDISGAVNTMVTPELLKARLTEINATTPFNLAFNPALEKVINSYLKYRKKYYPALMARANYYFPIFEQYLDQYDIPLEMKYLAIVESALHPKAKSRVGATGLWQFMYGTGKQYKLAVNSYVDERQDPVKSTIAACKYLNYLYELFYDWDLALAAYNSGPGNVLKAIKRSGGYRNYWNIRPFLPIETAGYVPAFYATMYIFKFQKELGISPLTPKLYHFETDTVQVKRTVSFDHIAEKTGINHEILSLLNPKYKIEVIPYIKNKKFSVRLPRNKVIDFLNKEHEIYELAAAEEALREKPLPKYFEMDKRIRYKVKPGDYLGKIANKFGVKVKDIKRWNTMRSTNLKIGQRLFIYPRRM